MRHSLQTLYAQPLDSPCTAFRQLRLLSDSTLAKFPSSCVVVAAVVVVVAAVVVVVAAVVVVVVAAVFCFVFNPRPERSHDTY